MVMVERVTLQHGGVCNVDASDIYPGALHVTINNGATLTPPECDALIAALHKALGRPSTPLDERIATEQGPPVDLSDICSEGREEEVYGEGYAKGRSDAAAMVREAGPTVPRAAVEALRDLLLSIESGMEDFISDKFEELLATTDAAPAPKEPDHADD